MANNADTTKNPEPPSSRSPSTPCSRSSATHYEGCYCNEARHHEEKKKLREEIEELRSKYAMHHAEAERLTRVERAAWDVVNHWETPLWKNTPPTAQYINKLRNALSCENADVMRDDGKGLTP